MESLTAMWQSRAVNLITSTLFGVLWLLFASAHLAAFRQQPDAALPAFALAETLVAILYVLRSTPQSVSLHPIDWVVGGVSTFLPMLLRPQGPALLPAAALVVAGALLQVGALLSLNRSIAIVAARRALKTRGLYRLVRHPLYASHVLTHIGYTLCHASAANLALCISALLLLLLRMLREERHLGQDPAYRAYMRRVRYRVFPYVF